MFDYIDRDRSGAITADEFAAACVRGETYEAVERWMIGIVKRIHEAIRYSGRDAHEVFDALAVEPVKKDVIFGG